MAAAGTKDHADAYVAGLHGRPLSDETRAATPGDGSVTAAYDEGRRAGGHRPAHDRPRVSDGTGQRTASTGTASTETSEPKPRAKKGPTNAQQVARRARSAATKTYSAAGGPGVATQLWHVVWMAMALVVLYLILTSAATDNRFVAGILAAVKWIMSPTAVI